LTEESAAEVVQAVLSLGARRYKVNAEAEGDLLAAVAAVISGKTFVGRI
jgi:DNA-binding NarL/FixJ family response regulator